MDIISFILALAVLAVTAFFVMQPLLDRKLARQPLVVRRKIIEDEHQRSILMAERERVLSALTELEQDHDMGKLADEDYPLHRSALMQKGADVLRQLDELNMAASEPGNGQTVKLAAPTPGEDDLEALIAARRQDRKEKVVAYCGSCGHPVQSTDKFCPHCGAGVGE